jgi:hypothetical protein
MMSEVDIDVRPYRDTSKTLSKLIVAVLLVAGVTLSAVGLQHKSSKTETTVSWHNVSDTLHQVELAKADLFATLRDKSP